MGRAEREARAEEILTRLGLIERRNDLVRTVLKRDAPADQYRVRNRPFAASPHP